MDIDEIAQDVFDEIEASSTKWRSSSKYVRIKGLEIDKRGSFGERLIKHIFEKEGVSVVYQGGNPGDWDIVVNNVRIEVKTASMDVNGKFQNENIKDTEDCDCICFIGVAPDSIFMKLEKICEIDFSKLHNRASKGTGAGYKWDLKPDDMTEIKTSEEVVKMFCDKGIVTERSL